MENYKKFFFFFFQDANECWVQIMRVLQQKLESQEPETPLEVNLSYYMWRVIDWYRFFITDTDYLYVYVPDNRYTEPIFIYCYKVHK